MNKKKRYIIDGILIVIALFCFGKIGIKYYKYHLDKVVYNDIKEFKPIIQDVEKKSTDEEPKDEVVKKVVEEEKLRESNNDYKFWIEVPSTNIDYPVVQGQDNDYYLNRNFNKDSSISGSIYLDYRNDVNTDKNLLIYGHNMKNGSMFADITKFNNKEFADNNKIKIIKDGKEYIYEVFSSFVVDGNYEGLQIKFDSDEVYKLYIEDIKNKSVYKRDVNSDFSNIITLFTCSYEFESARTLVFAALVES